MPTGAAPRRHDSAEGCPAAACACASEGARGGGGERAAARASGGRAGGQAPAPRGCREAERAPAGGSAPRERAAQVGRPLATAATSPALPRPDLASRSTEASVVTLRQVPGCRGNPPHVAKVSSCWTWRMHLRDLGAVELAALEPPGSRPHPGLRSAAARPPRWRWLGKISHWDAPAAANAPRGGTATANPRGGCLASQLPPQQSSPTF